MNAPLKFYWKLLLRRLPAMALLFLVCTSLGLVLAVRLPTIYATSARLLVEAPQISPDLATPTVQISASEEIEIIRQQLLTRANLIDIANDMNVVEPGTRLSPDEIVELMRDSTTFDTSGGGRQGAAQPTIVDVGFRARTGQIAAAVVNEYVTRITAANVRNRTGAAEDTLAFFEQEVERLSGDLDLQSARISEFQRENAGALPEGQDYRLNRQALLQERLGSLQREIDGLTEQRAALVDIFEATGSLGPTAPNAQTPEQARVAELERNLSAALAIYSETNPRVVQLRAQLDRAREALVGATPADDAATQNPQDALYRLQLTDLDTRIARLEEQIPAIEREQERLQEAIVQTPLNTITLQGMERDYANIQLQYDTAVNRLSQASTGAVIEQTARGQRIALIEAANVPTSPASPNRPVIAAAGIGAGLVLAVGLFLLLELLNGAVRRPVDIQRGLGIVPLATIPYIESRTRRNLRRGGQILAMLFVVIGVPAALWAVDTYYIPLDLLAQRALDKLGLA